MLTTFFFVGRLAHVPRLERLLSSSMSAELQLSPTDSEWPVPEEQHSEHLGVAHLVELGVLEKLVVELEM
eukprot:6520237-Prorocentrum_lima.AAC.1